MSIYVSATSIKDYLVCPKRVFYRTNFPELIETNVDMKIGTAVHETIEKFWFNKEAALADVTTRIESAGLSHENLKKATTSINTFFASSIYELLGKGDLIEHRFKVPLDEGSFLVGKIDRITGNGILMDWKTATVTPRSIDNDPQFLLYFLAYKVMMKKNPTSVLYVSLAEEKVVRLNFNRDVYFQLVKFIIPSMVNKIRKNDLPPIGLFSGGCYRCPFKETCARDMQNEGNGQ